MGKPIETKEFFTGPGARGRSIILRSDIDPRFNPSNRPMGEWSPKLGGLYKFSSMATRKHPNLTSIRLDKGTKREEHYSIWEDYWELGYERGFLGALQGDWREFDGYRWAPLEMERGKSYQFDSEFTIAQPDQPLIRDVVVNSECRIRRVSTKKGRRAFTLDVGADVAFELLFLKYGLDSWLSLKPRACDLLTITQDWGNNGEFRELYFYIRGIGLVGHMMLQKFDKEYHEPVRLLVLDTKGPE